MERHVLVVEMEKQVAVVELENRVEIVLDDDDDNEPNTSLPSSALSI